MIKKVALRATYPTFLAKTPRIWTFQKIDPEISVIFWNFVIKKYLFRKIKLNYSNLRELMGNYQ